MRAMHADKPSEESKVKVASDQTPPNQPAGSSDDVSLFSKALLKVGQWYITDVYLGYVVIDEGTYDTRLVSPFIDTSLAPWQIARIITVSELSNSEKLYKLSIDVGNGETKQVSIVIMTLFRSAFF